MNMAYGQERVSWAIPCNSTRLDIGSDGFSDGK